MIEKNKAIATQFIKALGDGDAVTVKALITEDIEAICMGTSLISGTRHYQDVIAAASMFPKISTSGLNPTILSLTAEGDRVSCEWEGKCTLVNGSQYNNQYHFLLFIRDGRICKLKEYMDTKLADAVLAPLFAASAG